MKYIKSALFIRNNYTEEKICGQSHECQAIFNSFIVEESKLLRDTNMDIDKVIELCLENFDATNSRMNSIVGLHVEDEYVRDYYPKISENNLGEREINDLIKTNEVTVSNSTPNSISSFNNAKDNNGPKEKGATEKIINSTKPPNLFKKFKSMMFKS